MVRRDTGGSERRALGHHDRLGLAPLAALTMVAFAANSILNRLALADELIGPAGFAAIRVAAGAAVLLALLAARERAWPRPGKPDFAAIAGLAIYLVGFSFAYVSMDAGLGALILFGGVQVTMFGGALLAGQRPPLQRWGGMGLALAGLAVLSFPQGPFAVSAGAFLLMATAALGWGVYSLAGQKVTDPLAATGWNFVYALPFVFVALLFWPDTTGASAGGVLLAVLSGGVTSALGYALWYRLLPSLGATRGALAQLSVPAIALALGAVLLGETVTGTALLAAAMILGGIAVGLVRPRAS